MAYFFTTSDVIDFLKNERKKFQAQYSFLNRLYRWFGFTKAKKNLADAAASLRDAITRVSQVLECWVPSDVIQALCQKRETSVICGLKRTPEFDMVLELTETERLYLSKGFK
jgi:DUF1365 family protein